MANNKNDKLYGNDWTPTVTAIKDRNDNIGRDAFKLDSIPQFNPQNYKSDVLFGLNGDDLMIGDGDNINTADLAAGNADIEFVGAPLAAPDLSFSAHRTVAAHTRNACVNPVVDLRRTHSVDVACMNDLQLVATLKIAA